MRATCSATASTWPHGSKRSPRYSVREQVGEKLPIRFSDLGEHGVKNIARPVRVYRVENGAEPNAGAAGAPTQDPFGLADSPSLAVMPFTNMSGDPEQEYFVDGIVEDIITGLSRIKWLFVIARNSTFTYKGRAVDVKQVGREARCALRARRQPAQGGQPGPPDRSADRCRNR
jgi:hypothetical protein